MATALSRPFFLFFPFPRFPLFTPLSPSTILLFFHSPSPSPSRISWSSNIFFFPRLLVILPATYNTDSIISARHHLDSLSPP